MWEKARMGTVLKTTRTLGVMFGGMALGILLLGFLMAGDIYEYVDSVDGAHLPPVDAIVCLAGGRGRIAAAADIWYRYYEMGKDTLASSPVNPHAPILYISGMGHQSNWNVLANQVRRGVLDVLHPENVILETESSNTDANAKWLERYARAHGWNRILLVTSPYHMKRARFIFERVLKSSSQPVALETYSLFQEPFAPGEWRSNLHGIRLTMLEYFKGIYYKFIWKG